MNETENIEIGEDSFEINANEKDSVIIQRHFTKHTKLDSEKTVLVKCCFTND